MFYVEKWKRDKKRELAMIHIGPPIIVFLAFLGITIWSWLDANKNIEETRSQILSNHIQDTKSGIQNRLTTYEDILRAGAGLFDASNEVSASEWKDFVEIFEINKRHPGIQGIGYTQVIRPDQLQSHIQANRSAGQPGYQVFPEGERPLYTSILYIEPMNEANQKAIGFDMYSEQTRRTAMNLARDTGSTTLTDVVTLIQDSDTMSSEPGFLMYVPVYIQGAPKNTQTDREKNITGYVYAPFRSQNFLKEFSNEFDDPNFSFKIYDAQQTPDKLLYESPSYRQLNAQKNKQSTTETFTINNKAWIIEGVIAPNAVSASERNRPAALLLGGIIISLFIGSFIYLLLLNRTRALSGKEEREIQDAKDELLALASHQLRTPATGVKQYLGLVREGYAGAINKDQRAYIDKAYESNERQLDTINEMLFVARSDAGYIKLMIEEVDLSSLMLDSIDEQISAIKEKHQRLNRDFPKEKVLIQGDEQYLRMAIENIISNATKYTPEYGSVSVRLEALDYNVKITVKDTGVGVSQKDYELLFRKFSRIPNELTSQVNGSGIGLYLTRTIIEAHNGTIDFDSTVNVGSIITVTLPKKHQEKTEEV